MQQAWHAKGREDLLVQLGVTENTGLTKEEAHKRLARYGPNALHDGAHTAGVGMLLKQVANPLVFILILAFLAMLYLGETVDAFVIAVALIVNIVIGFIQEYRANKAFEALVVSEEHTILILREGKKEVVRSNTLVPGDIMFVEPGTVVPADAYLLTSSDCTVSEAHLTGESQPVEKHTGILDETTPLYERGNMLFMGSSVLSGVATALVVETGMQAEVGHIAESLEGKDIVQSPVEASIKKLARFLSLIVVGVIVLLVSVGLARGTPLAETLLLAVAIAVSVVPEGLPAAVTAILAVGMEHILRKRGLVRTLFAAETLGSTTVILTDKTGTLTEATMRVVAIATLESDTFEATALSPGQKQALSAALCASDVLLLEGEKKELYGRPVEKAVASLALDAGIFERLSYESKNRIDFLKFSSQRRFAVSLYRKDEHTKENTLYASGAPETLLAHANFYYEAGIKKEMTPEVATRFKATMDTFTEAGKRVIAVSSAPYGASLLSRASDNDLLHGSVFLGLIALADPVRADVPEAIQEVMRAGVRVVMVTGDTPKTAYAIAIETGIARPGARVVTGTDIETLDDEALTQLLLTEHIFARILPRQKKRLVEVLQAHGEIVGMTGDGVNDAPALSAATIGIAVGSGTEVARESSDLILLGDSFSIIVSAIREGRRIMDNLKKAVTHLITTSFHEVFIITVAVFAGLPLPILPVQILWVNILEEGFLTFGFAFEPGEKGIMKQRPQSLHLRTVLTKEIKQLIMLAGVITGVFSTALFLWLVARGVPVEEIRTIMFVVLSLDSLMFAFSLKQLRRPLWTTHLFNNHYLLFAIALSTLGIVATFAFAPLRSLLSLTVPNAFDIWVLVGVALVNLLTIEGAKKIVFRANGTLGTWKHS